MIGSLEDEKGDRWREGMARIAKVGCLMEYILRHYQRVEMGETEYYN